MKITLSLLAVSLTAAGLLFSSVDAHALATGRGWKCTSSLLCQIGSRSKTYKAESTRSTKEAATAASQEAAKAKCRRAGGTPVAGSGNTNCVEQTSGNTGSEDDVGDDAFDGVIF